VTNFAPIEPETATGQAAELLTQVKRTLGLTPNMTKVMANSPALLKAYLALAGAVSGGVLRAGVRERLAISTAQLNGCEYCLSAHTYIGANIARVDSGDLDAARKAQPGCAAGRTRQRGDRSADRRGRRQAGPERPHQLLQRAGRRRERLARHHPMSQEGDT
jgi:AhpD family alkylhydroperoxidase